MAITFEQAKKRALSISDKFNICYEYKDAYHFFDTNDSDVIGALEIVILKESGKEIGFTSFLLDYHPERNPKKRKL